MPEFPSLSMLCSQDLDGISATSCPPQGSPCAGQREGCFWFFPQQLSKGDMGWIRTLCGRIRRESQIEQLHVEKATSDIIEENHGIVKAGKDL